MEQGQEAEPGDAGAHEPGQAGQDVQQDHAPQHEPRSPQPQPLAGEPQSSRPSCCAGPQLGLSTSCLHEGQKWETEVILALSLWDYSWVFGS